jgi:O-methyltransferase involved in polyketide biosynthesis
MKTDESGMNGTTPSEKLHVSLSGVPETLLWPLWFRAAEARSGSGFFTDPLGIEVVDKIAFDFEKFGRPNKWHAVRARYSDNLISEFLSKHPGATVVSLGEGLETQFWRVDDGTVTWLSVDLPESIAVRRRLLPTHPRNLLLECSALDPGWMDHVDRSQGTFISAAGLLMYFSEQDVLGLLGGISSRFSGGELFFDTIPLWLSRLTQKGWKTTARYQTPPMPFGIRLGDLTAFLAHVPRLDLVRAISYPEAFPGQSPVLALLARVPWMRDQAPGLVHARVRSPAGPKPFS